MLCGLYKSITTCYLSLLAMHQNKFTWEPFILISLLLDLKIRTGFNWLLSLKCMLLNRTKRHQLRVSSKWLALLQAPWSEILSDLHGFCSFCLGKIARLVKNSCLQVMKLYSLWFLLVLFTKSHLTPSSFSCVLVWCLRSWCCTGPKLILLIGFIFVSLYSKSVFIAFWCRSE